MPGVHESLLWYMAQTTGRMGSRGERNTWARVPRSASDIPPSHRAQMDAYVEALKEARAIISSWNSRAMKVRTSLSLPEQAGPFEYENPTPEGYSDLTFQKLEDRWTFTRFDPLTFRYAEREMTIQGCSLEDDEILEAVAHWNFHLYRFNERVTASQELRPQVQLHLLDTEQGSELRPLLSKAGADLLGLAPAEDVRCCPLSTYKVPVKVKEARVHDLTKYYGVTLINNSTFDLYPYVFYFDPSTYGIQVSSRRRRDM